MYCMKCGKEIPESRAFCDSCLTVMAKRPVKPGTPVLLPVRTEAPVKKAAPRKRQRTTEEQMHKLQGTVKWMSLALTCVVLALVLTVSFLIHTAAEQKADEEIGRNYNTANTAIETE